MLVEGFRRPGRDNFSHPAAQVAIRTAAGQLVALAVELDGTLVVAHAEEPGFADLAASLGLIAPKVKPLTGPG